MLTEQGEVQLNLVAKRAGVGQGTLYRHFPTRDALLAELYRAEVAELVAYADELLETDDAVTALGRWFGRVADYAEVKRGVMAAVEASQWQGMAAHSHGSIGAALTSLLHAGAADGTLRTDVDGTDIIVLIGYLARLDLDDYQARARHLLTVILDGLASR